MPGSQPYIDVRIGGIKNPSGELDLTVGQYGRIAFPFELPDSGISKAHVDLEIISALLRDNPEGVRSIVQAVLSGDGAEVRRLSADMGLTESDFQAKGGGLFWAVVIVGVLCCASEAR